jgi:hypothetical protein
MLYWVLLGCLSPFILIAIAWATTLTGRTFTWFMAVGVFATSFAVGRIRRNRFYVPGLSVLVLAVLWFALAAMWPAWRGAIYMAGGYPLFFSIGIISVLAGYLASKAK